MTRVITTEIFPTHVYHVDAPELLPLVRQTSLASLEGLNPENPLYPMIMGHDIEGHDDMYPFCEYVGKTAHKILIDQGYDVRNKSVQFSELWCQEHRTGSSMEQHVHGNRTQLVGFYFIDVPPGAMVATFHDPRIGKVQSQENQENLKIPTYASTIVSVEPYPGLLLFTNAWLPHSFSRNLSNDPVRFIHFNVSVTENTNIREVEVV